MLYYLISMLFGFLGLVFFHVYTHWNNCGKLINKIHGPPALPILGNILDLRHSPAKLFMTLVKWGTNYYPRYKLWLLNIPVVVIQSPDDAEALLTNPNLLWKKIAYDLLHPWLNTGLLTSSGEKWRHRRKILTPAFHFKILQKYLEVTRDQSSKAVEEIKALGKESKINLIQFCSDHTLNIISESAMGVSLNTSKDVEAKLYKDAVYKMGNFTIYRFCRPYIRDWMLPFMPRFNKEYKQICRNLSDFTNKTIKERREFHNSTDFKNFDQPEDGDMDAHAYNGKRRMAMLDLLISAERDGLIDNEGIKEEVSTFIFAGHDTTAMALTYFIMLLAENKQAQKLAREEIEEIMIKTNGILGISDLQQMNYLERCIKELLRLYPSASLISRHLTEDITLGENRIPKHSNLVLHIYNLHRNPKYWPQPTIFDPDRFLPDQVKNRHSFAYVPFSAGPRNCIGQKFAILEMKCLMAYLLYNFYLEPIDYTSDINLITHVVLRPEKLVYTKFIAIDRIK